MGTNDIVKFEALSPAEFFRRNREIAGFSNPTRAVYQTIRELVENSLDATETFKILPSIKIYIDYADQSRNWVSIYVEDNGIGIPGDEIPMSLAGYSTVVSIGLSSTGVSSGSVPRWLSYTPNQPRTRQSSLGARH